MVVETDEDSSEEDNGAFVEGLEITDAQSSCKNELCASSTSFCDSKERVFASWSLRFFFCACCCCRCSNFFFLVANWVENKHIQVVRSVSEV